jgi:hypothetical protein
VAYNVNAKDIKFFQGLKIPTSKNHMTTIFSAAARDLGEMHLEDISTTNVKKF